MGLGEARMRLGLPLIDCLCYGWTQAAKHPGSLRSPPLLTDASLAPGERQTRDTRHNAAGRRSVLWLRFTWPAISTHCVHDRAWNGEGPADDNTPSTEYMRRFNGNLASCSKELLYVCCMVSLAWWEPARKLPV